MKAEERNKHFRIPALHFKTEKKDVLKCAVCDKPFVRVSENIWKPNCKHINKEIRVSVG